MKHSVLKDAMKECDERDENNRRIIRLNVSDDSNFLSPFSVKGSPLIRPKLHKEQNRNIAAINADIVFVHEQ